MVVARTARSSNVFPPVPTLSRLAFGVELLAVVLAATLPFAAASRSGLRATGIGYDRRVTIIQFVAGFVLFIVTIAAAIGVAVGEARALYIVGGVAVLSLLWGVFNTWELIFRIQSVDGASR